MGNAVMLMLGPASAAGMRCRPKVAVCGPKDAGMPPA